MADKPTLIRRAREMRHEPSSAERAVWDILRNRRLGAKFRRQHPVEGYIADFACTELKMVVEVDGRSHDSQVGYNARRDAVLKEAGWRVLRIRDGDVLSDQGAIERRIRAALGT